MSRMFNPDTPYFADDGTVAALGTIYFGQPDQDPKTNPKVPYLDKELTTPGTASYTLTSGGKLPQPLWIKSVTSFTVDDSAAVQITNDPYWVGAADAISTAQQFDTVALMIASATISDKDVVETVEYDTDLGSAGSGKYRARPVTGAPADLGGLFKSTGVPALELVLLPPGFVTVKQFSAAGDASTDDSPAFNAARDYAEANNLPVFVPPSSTYYRLTSKYQINARGGILYGLSSDVCVLYMDGVDSVIVADGAQHFYIHDIGISGSATSGNGIEIINSCHFSRVEDVWIGWVNGAGIKQVNAVSMRYTSVEVDQNNGYRPSGLPPASLGLITRPWDIDGGGQNNDPKLVQCHANGAGKDGGLRCGEAVGGSVQSFKMIGGLIQGLGSRILLELQVNYGIVLGVHMEDSGPLDPAIFALDFDNCNQLEVKNCNISGDARIQNSIDTGFTKCIGTGFVSEPTNSDCFFDDVQYGGLSSGPAAGQLKALAGDERLRYIRNNANSGFTVGDNISERRQTIMHTDMELFNGTVPVGFVQSGGTTSIETGTVKNGSRSVKFVTTGASDFLQTVPDPIAMLDGKTMTIELWVYNVSVVGLANLQIRYDSGATTLTQQTYRADAWERMVVSFPIPEGTADVAVRLSTSVAGTVYFDSWTSQAENFEHPTFRTLANSATPNLLGTSGKQSRFVKTGGTTTITDFEEYSVGQEFTIQFDHATTITHNASIIRLNGSGDFVGAVGDNLTLVRMDDNITSEVGRMKL